MARLLIYDAYENKVYTYANLNENDPMPYSTLHHPAAAGVPGQIGQPYPVDHHCRHGGVEPDPPQIRQGHPGGVRLPPHLGRVATAPAASTTQG